MAELFLVTGGSRSGKSAFGEKLAGRVAAATGGRVVYLATGAASDPEMAERIAKHRDRRPPGWETVEVGAELVPTVATRVLPGACLLLDCLTGWIGRCLADGWPAERILAEVAGLDRLIAEGAAPTVVVSGEVGDGVVPATPLGRAFRDAAGEANQRLAARAAAVYLVVAGMPLNIQRLAERTEGEETPL